MYHQFSWHASWPASWLTFLPFSRIALQQSSLSGRLVLYHFVGSSSASSANPLLMLRRFTIQVKASCGLYLYLLYSTSKYASTVNNIIEFRLCFLVIGWFTTNKCLEQNWRAVGKKVPRFFGHIWECSKIAEFWHVGFALPLKHCSEVLTHLMCCLTVYAYYALSIIPGRLG